MSTFRHAWASLLDWVPPPLQAGLALVIALLIITKLAPRITRGCGTMLKVGWAPSLQLLTYPEYLLTITLRRNGHQPLPGTYAYGRLLGALAPPGTQLGQWMSGRFQRKPRFPWKTTILVIALLAGCWYLAPNVPPGTPRTFLANINTDDTHVSTWLATGQWTPAPTPPRCTAITARAKPRPHKKSIRQKKQKKR